MVSQMLADQDWISFRPNVFALQDLASKWIERIKARLAEAQRSDTVTEHVHQVHHCGRNGSTAWTHPFLFHSIRRRRRCPTRFT